MKVFSAKYMGGLGSDVISTDTVGVTPGLPEPLSMDPVDDPPPPPHAPSISSAKAHEAPRMCWFLILDILGALIRVSG
jgi:hypothetical protein